MELQFRRFEFEAVVSLALAMIHADGDVDFKETMVLQMQLDRFGIGVDQYQSLVVAAKNMDKLRALSIITNLGYTEKKYITALVGVLMAADGKIDDSEMKMWTFTSLVCDLPQMSIDEAFEIIKGV
jgi:tellurite resistance protein